MTSAAMSTKGAPVTQPSQQAPRSPRPDRIPQHGRSPHPALTRPGDQRGAALIVSLLLLAIVMLLATAGWQMGSQEERMVGQQRGLGESTAAGVRSRASLQLSLVESG